MNAAVPESHPPIAAAVTSEAAASAPPEALPAALRWSFAMLLLMLVLAALDGTIVATALPSIAADLHGGDRLSWLFSAYLIAATVAVPLYGKLADLHGSKPVLLVAVLLFLIGSAVCGLSQDMGLLIAARGLQGAGGGGLLTLAMTAVVRVFPPASRARLQGLLGAVYGLATMVGPLAGGLLVEHLSWRWAFLINLPVGLLAAVALALNFPRQAASGRGGMDLPGAVLLSAALVALMLGTRRGADGVDALPAPALIGAGLLLATLFVGWQARAREPLLPLALFRQRAFVGASLISATSGVALFAVVLFMPLYMQSARGLAPLASSLHLMPLMAGITLGAIGCGRLLAARGRARALAQVSSGLTGVSFIVLGLVLHGVQPSLLLASACLLPLGLGIGLSFPLVTVVAQSAAPLPLMGVATASPVMFRSVAAALGISALAALFEHNVVGLLAAPGSTRLGVFGAALGPVFGVVALLSVLAAVAARGLPQQLVRPAGR